MPSRPEDVLVVKLRRELADELRQLGERWQLSYARGSKAPGNPDGKCLSLNAIVEILLRRQLRKMERSRTRKVVRYQG